MVKVGSRVKFLHSTGSGIVRSINGNLANVEVDGFEIPALISDIVEVPIEAENAAIVKIGPSDPKVKRIPGVNPSLSIKSGQRYGKVTIDDPWEDDSPAVDVAHLKRQYAANITQKTIEAQPAPQPPKIEKAPFQETDYAVCLAFVPTGKGKPETQDLDAYLVNDSSYELFYTVAAWRNGYVETIKVGRLEADTKEHLKRFDRSSFAQIQTLHIALQPFKSINFVPQMVENFDIELHPLKFIRSGNYAVNDYFDEPSFIFSLTGDHQSYNLDEITPKSEDKKIAKKPAPPVGVQIEDLHIEAIMEQWSELTSGEVLAAQIARFNFVMETASKSNYRGKIVFIHGVGKGKLKYELKKELDRRYSKLRYQDASFAEYGYGAIMVFV